MRSVEEVRPAINRLFKTRDGELVLEYLLDKFYHNRIKDESMARQVGQRDVMLHVKQLAEERHVQK